MLRLIERLKALSWAFDAPALVALISGGRRLQFAFQYAGEGGDYGVV
jgi:hypothetical protein